jgi:FeS assembly SUF system protein
MSDRETTLHDFMPGFGPGGEDAVGYGGEPLAEGAPVATEDDLIEAIRTVYDPELPVNIYDLGLIYKLEPGPRGAVRVEMTLTAPGCPVAGEMPQMVADALVAADGVGTVEVHLVWDPPWTQDRLTEAAKLELGLV